VRNARRTVAELRVPEAFSLHHNELVVMSHGLVELAETTRPKPANRRHPNAHRRWDGKFARSILRAD
jgi:hypothetical protein